MAPLPEPTLPQQAAFAAALASKGIVLDPRDQNAALVIFTYLAKCRESLHHEPG